MRILASLLLASAVSAACAPAALAAECQQAQAIYTDRDGAYELSFEPVGSEAAVVSHHFKIRQVKGDLLLNGHIMTGDEVARSNAMVMHNCPTGDVTGDEIAACTVWEGVMYPVAPDGAIGELVPGEDAKAAHALLLAGFGPALRYSGAWEEKKLTDVPWDLLTFKGCAN